ncbi:hypothetical protein DSO57_1009667 [Entomophthora muscae]|uniref:Uncharacterized protein n=1 Tax=Entomophthora muscae TaxID=34485 RepID=A0ACC2SVS5_9FUNG|nr:hypothetical protein DSO57_1009667 [Entomophthora muscae]
MHHVIRLLQYIPYNLILNQIISERWGPATGTLLSVPPNVNFMPANFAAPPPILENENCVHSQCPEFYAKDALMLSQVIYLGLLWLGLIVLLNPRVTIGNFTKKYLKPRWWLIINSMWIWVAASDQEELMGGDKWRGTGGCGRISSGKVGFREIPGDIGGDYQDGLSHPLEFGALTCYQLIPLRMSDAK